MAKKNTAVGTTGKSSSLPSLEDLKAWAKEELTTKAKREANLQLAKTLLIFFGSVFVARNFGEALFVG